MRDSDVIRGAMTAGSRISATIEEDHHIGHDRNLGQGDALVRLERYTDAERRYQQAEQAIHADGSIPPDPSLDILAKLGRADAALGLGRLGEADFAYQHAESLARQATFPDLFARCSIGHGQVAALRAELIAADQEFFGPVTDQEQLLAALRQLARPVR